MAARVTNSPSVEIGPGIRPISGLAVRLETVGKHDEPGASRNLRAVLNDIPVLRSAALRARCRAAELGAVEQ